MNNGVEVIVAKNRKAKPSGTEYLRLLSSTVIRPLTLAPHTLTNFMSMVLSSERVIDDPNSLVALLRPTLTTKTYYTVYNYITTTLKDNTTAVINAKTSITNFKTEPISQMNPQEEVEPTKTFSYTLRSSPILQTKVFSTEYTYLNTYQEASEERPLVASSILTISNTLIGAHGDALDELEPSEVFPMTNTHLKTVGLGKTPIYGTGDRVASTNHPVTQVVVTDNPTRGSTASLPLTTNVTKTYFVTYTYFSTYVDGDQTRVKSDVSVSSDVTIEKFYIKPKKTETMNYERTESPMKLPVTFPFNIVVTKTYQTTFTYFTTLLQGSTETRVNSKTKIVENTVAETISQQDFDADCLIELNSSLQRISGSIVATATLKKGEVIVMTAYKSSPLKESYQKYEIEPTKTISNVALKTKWNQMQELEESGEGSAFSGTETGFISIEPSKTVIDEPVAEALIRLEEEDSMSTVAPAASAMPSSSSSLVGHEAPSSSDRVDSADGEGSSAENFGEKNPEEETVSTTNPPEKNQGSKEPATPNNGSSLLNLNSFNGMNVLGPVFNAMAELINNKITKNVEGISRRNDTIVNNNHEQIVKKPSSGNVNPILDFVNKFTSGPAESTSEPKMKPTSPRTPVYIPVGSFGQDLEEITESNRRVLVANGQDNWYEKWQNIQAKNFEKVRPHDSPIGILEGGIPISPGQVITTNSDIIIGRPGESGPRPPTFALKNDITLDMVPPPRPPSNTFASVDEDHFVGQQSNKKVNYQYHNEESNVKPDRPVSPPKKVIEEGQNIKISRPYSGDRYKGSPPSPPKNTPPSKNTNTRYDSGGAYLNPPPVPPPPIHPHDPNRSHHPNRPVGVNYRLKQESVAHKSPQNVIGVPIHAGESVNLENYINPADINPSIFAVPPVPVLGPVHPGTVLNAPTPNLDAANLESVLHLPVGGNLSPTINPDLVDRSTGHPFLVNIQPSQVANVVIPHGSSTGLFVSEEKHSMKGEVIDDPSPHPEPETVGFVGAEPVLKIENEVITAGLQNELIPAETEEELTTNLQLGRPSFPDHARPSTNQFRIPPKPFSDFDKPSQQNAYFHLGQNSQFIQQSSLNFQQNASSASSAFHHLGSPPFDDQLRTESQKNHHFQGQSSGIFLNENLNFNAQNSVKGIADGEYLKTYRREPNVHGNLGPLDFKNIFDETNHKEAEAHRDQNRPISPDDLHSDRIRFKQGQNLERGETHGNASSLKHSTVGPNGNHFQGHSSTKQQSMSKESLINHQSGIVRPNSGQKIERNPLQEILIGQNSNEHEQNPKVGPQYFEHPQNLNKRPLNDFSNDLSPPPLPHRPTHQASPAQKLPQRYRPHSHHQSVPQPLDFMIPPPETPNRLKLKHQTEPNSRPIIPIGAVAPLQHYVRPRPVDMVIVPHRPTRPETGLSNQNVKRKRPGSQVANGYYDLDVSDTSGPLKTESEEELEEESISHTFFPNQGDLIQFNRNFSSQFVHHPKPMKNIGSVEITENHALNGSVRKPDPVATAVQTNSYKNSSAQGVGSNAGQYKGHVNHKETSNAPKRNDQTSSFKISLALGGTAETDSSKIGSANVPSAFIPFNNVTSNANVRIQGVKPHSQPTEFVKNENSAIKKQPSSGTSHGSAGVGSIHATSNKDNIKFVKETLSDDVFFGSKDKITESTYDQNKKTHEPSSEKKGNKVPTGSQGQAGSFSGHKDQPGRHGSSNRPYIPNLQSNSLSQNYSRPKPGAGVSQITGSIQTSAVSAGATNDNRNKISVGYPTITNVPIRDGDANALRKPFLPTDSFGQGSAQVKRPLGFSGTEDLKEANKLFSGTATTASEEETPSVTTDLKNGPNENNYIKPSLSDSKNGTFLFVNSNQNHGNKTVSFYHPKPTSETAEAHGTYNKPSNERNEANKWFISNFSNNNNKKNVYGHQNTSKFTTEANESNFGSGSQQNTSSKSPSTLMTPPRVAESEEVMGLSPPPLNRHGAPQGRPQRPQRPKPVYKFEIAGASKATTSAPIGMENDFPHDRSPEFNRKPFKPQDIFPPRLPEDFVHRLPEYPAGAPPVQKPVTSSPANNGNQNPPHLYGTDTDFDEDYDEEPFFAGSEINGHSKPLEGDDASPITKRPLRFGEVFDSDESKSVVPAKIKETSGPWPTEQQSQRVITKSSKRGETSSTPAIATSVTKTRPTKMNSATVTASIPRPQEEWQEADIITGSKVSFDPNRFSSNHATPAIDSGKVITTFVSSGSTTIFGNSFTQRPNWHWEGASGLPSDFEGKKESAIVPTETTTLTVTTTMTTVVHGTGHKPFAKTIVLTKTLLSTVFNKVTETKTLVKPTTATLIQTHTVAATETALPVPAPPHPSQTRPQAGGTLKPEIFFADPHAKDTMTISVSSSLSNTKKTEPKGRPAGTSPTDRTGEGGSIVVVVSSHDHLSDQTGVEEESEIDESGARVRGVFDPSTGSKEGQECSPGCQSARNEACQRIKGVMQCVCRPGFARTFPDTPCRPTYTYKIKLGLDKLGSENLNYEKNLAKPNSANVAKLTSVTKEGLDRMIMQSELRDIYQGVFVNGFEGKQKKTMVDFYVQLSENTDEEKLMNIFTQTLQNSNYSLGGTELFAAREADNLDAEDFNECLNPKFHDCSEHARCFNLKGTYTCSCQEGYADMSENSLFPGRICSDAIGCEYCGYHGACYSKDESEITCKCFQWYSGDRCNINLKVLLIALVTIGAILLAFLLVCAVLTCLKKKSMNSSSGRSIGYLRYRGGHSMHSIDRRAMISDSSSESSLDNIPYLTPVPLAPTAGTMRAKKKAVLKQVKGPVPRALLPPGMEQRSRSVMVMIPRAKYRPPPHLSSHLTMSTFSPEKHLPKTASQIVSEQKLISYLDGNQREDRSMIANNNKTHGLRQETEQQHKSYEKSSSAAAAGTILNESSRTIEKKKESRIFEYEYKISNMIFSEETTSAERKLRKLAEDRFRRHSDSTHLQGDSNRTMQFRKYSAGALVSAGYEVSAKVGMHQLDDDVTEDDQSAILNTHTMKSNHSQFTSLNRTGDHKTMSEARSYDETTVHPQTRSLKTDYSGSSPSSRANNDESHTMIERDLGSTFIMPESQLFKPEADRGSDISNFDSL